MSCWPGTSIEHGATTPHELKVIGSPLDFVGINVDCPKPYVVASDEAPGWRVVPFAKGHTKAAINDSPVEGPECLYWAPKLVHSVWGAKETFITENGCAGNEVIADDTDRIMFVRAELTQLQRAGADGVPMKATSIGARCTAWSGRRR